MTTEVIQNLWKYAKPEFPNKIETNSSGGAAMFSSRMPHRSLQVNTSFKASFEIYFKILAKA